MKLTDSWLLPFTSLPFSRRSPGLQRGPVCCWRSKPGNLACLQGARLAIWQCGNRSGTPGARIEERGVTERAERRGDWIDKDKIINFLSLQAFSFLFFFFFELKRSGALLCTSWEFFSLQRLFFILFHKSEKSGEEVRLFEPFGLLYWVFLLFASSMDVLANYSIFQELQLVHDTGYFSAMPSLEENWQQVRYDAFSLPFREIEGVLKRKTGMKYHVCTGFAGLLCVFGVFRIIRALRSGGSSQPRVVASFFFPPFLSLTWSTARSADRRKHTHTHAHT